MVRQRFSGSSLALRALYQRDAPGTGELKPIGEKAAFGEKRGRG